MNGTMPPEPSRVARTGLRIAHLYPDLLDLYGDRGNVLVLRRRAEWRGIPVDVDRIGIGDPYRQQDYDLVFLGGGQDQAQRFLRDDLLSRRDELARAIGRGCVFLCICGGYQMMGAYYLDAEGNTLEGLGLLDVRTEAGATRFIGNTAYRCDLLGNGPDAVIYAFENHAGRTRLGPGATPLARVLRGAGNNGEDGTEGLRYRNVFASYGHGSLLPKNPALADWLLALALNPESGTAADLAPLSDLLERSARDACARRLSL